MNLNFKLLNIVNNIKNRKPNLTKQFPEIESLYDKYSNSHEDSDLIKLGQAIKYYVIDFEFMRGYYIDLLIYLGYNPIPNEICISIMKDLYPTAEGLLELTKLPQKSVKKIIKKAYIKAYRKYILYRIKKFFQ